MSSDLLYVAHPSFDASQAPYVAAADVATGAFHDTPAVTSVST